MLADPHFKVLFHEQNSATIFPSTDIRGGGYAARLGMRPGHLGQLKHTQNMTN